MKHFNIYFLLLLLLTVSPYMSGQINDGEKHIFLVKGTTYTDTIISRFSPTIALVDNCSMLYSGLGQQRYKVKKRKNDF